MVPLEETRSHRGVHLVYQKPESLKIYFWQYYNIMYKILILIAYGNIKN